MYLRSFSGHRLKLSGQLAGIEAVPTPQKGEGGRTGNHESSRFFKEKLLGGTGCKPAGQGSNCLYCPFKECVAQEVKDWYSY